MYQALKIPHGRPYSLRGVDWGWSGVRRDRGLGNRSRDGMGNCGWYEKMNKNIFEKDP